MQEQPSKYTEYPLEHSSLFWRMEWLSLQDQHLPGCLLLVRLGIPVTHHPHRCLKRSPHAAKCPSITCPLQSFHLQTSTSCTLLPNVPRPSSPSRAVWGQSRILTGSLRLGSPSLLPAPSSCSSASSKLPPVWRTQLLPVCPCSTNK